MFRVGTCDRECFLEYPLLLLLLMMDSRFSTTALNTLIFTKGSVKLSIPYYSPNSTFSRALGALLFYPIVDLVEVSNSTLLLNSRVSRALDTLPSK